MVHDCVICGLSFEGELGDLLGMKYTCDLSMVSDHFERIELPSSSTLYDRLLGRPPAPTTFYRIVACWTCRYDLSNGIRHWLAGRYNVMPWDHRPDVGDCPICGAADQDGRTLQAVRLPAPPPLTSSACWVSGSWEISSATAVSCVMTSGTISVAGSMLRPSTSSENPFGPRRHRASSATLIGRWHRQPCVPLANATLILVIMVALFMLDTSYSPDLN